MEKQKRTYTKPSTTYTSIITTINLRLNDPNDKRIKAIDILSSIRIEKELTNQKKGAILSERLFLRQF